MKNNTIIPVAEYNQHMMEQSRVSMLFQKDNGELETEGVVVGNLEMGGKGQNYRWFGTEAEALASGYVRS